MGRYLVTGAAGFIAHRVIELLLEAGHQVVGVDNMNDAYDIRMKEHRLSLLSGLPGFKFFRVDICHRQKLQEIFTDQTGEKGKKAFDAVINLAARAGVRQSVIDPWGYVDTNVTGTLNLLEFCRLFEVPKFILASTSSVYGADAPLPTPEEAESNRPLQPYAASKKGAEALCHVYYFLYGLDVTVFRYFTVYGPFPRPDMVMFRFTQWISEGKTVMVNGDGEQMRGFTHLDDIARGTIMGLTPLGFEIINLGGHETIKINQLIALLEQLTGKRAAVEYLPRHPADMLSNWANVEKAQRLLGWAPRTPIAEGVAKLVRWYNTERQWASLIRTE
jgi:UDP-glucuronate 4-epimerase